MIQVKINKAGWEYDIHSLVKAFYPEETVKVLTPESVEKKPAEKPLQTFTITVEEKQITMKPEGGTLWTLNTADIERTAPAFKNEFKKFLYRSLSAYTGKKLPWGNLTGIRPTKIAMTMLEEGKEEAEVAAFFKQEHYVSQEKTELAIDIAKREKAILSQITHDGYSLYIGIPFCPTTCLYCSFTSYPIAAFRERVETYIDCLIREMQETARICKDKVLDTVYIGGGTPTTLEAEQLDRLIRNLKEIFDFSTVKEFTVEAGRADSITREIIDLLKYCDIIRISINPQTMKDETLIIIGRRHTVAQTVESFQLARELGFDDINMDLIMGLPEESLEDVRDTLEQVKALKPDNLTVHSLALKRAARLNMFKEDYKNYKMVNTTEHMNLTAEYAKEMGLEPYYLYRQKSMAGNLENVGYASPGKAGIYNILIMEEKQTIVACGAGASTKRVWNESNPDGTHRIERCENVKDVGQYIARIDEMIERKQKLFAEE